VGGLGDVRGGTVAGAIQLLSLHVDRLVDRYMGAFVL
jgi:hypothetical protein